MFFFFFLNTCFSSPLNFVCGQFFGGICRGRSPPSWRTAVVGTGGFTGGWAGPRLSTAPWELQAGGETHWVRTRRLSTHSTAYRGPLLPLSPVPWGTRWSQTMVMLELGWAAAQEPRTTGQQLLQQRTRQASPLGASKWCCDLLDRPHVTDSWRC